MREVLDTSILLARNGEDGAGASVLFLVHRAADGWLALDVAGKEIAVAAPDEPWTGPPIRLRHGGPEFEDRTFSLYALDKDPLDFGGLRVPAPGRLRFGFGGDLEAIVRAARAEASVRLVLFRGLTVLARRSRSIPEAWRIARASPEIVFEASRNAIARAALLPASSTPRSRWGSPTPRAGAPGSARARRG